MAPKGKDAVKGQEKKGKPDSGEGDKSKKEAKGGTAVKVSFRKSVSLFQISFE